MNVRLADTSQQASLSESCHAESIKYPATTEFVQIFCLEN